MYQKLIIIGNLGREPETRYTPAGEPVTEFSVATSRKFGDTGETTWFRVNVWGKQVSTNADKFIKYYRQQVTK